MSYRDFTYPQVIKQLSLQLVERALFPQRVDAALDEAFVRRLEEDAILALGLATEKARSEFIIAPVLLEVRRMLGCGVAVYSGVELNVDAAQGLIGICDFWMGRMNVQSCLYASTLTVV